MAEKKKGMYPILVLVILCLGEFVPNYTQYQLAPLASKLIETLGLTNSQYSSIFSAPMIPAIFLSLIAGLLVDRFGIKKVIGLGLTVTAAGTCWRVASGSYFSLFVSMMLTGVGICFLNANAAKIVGSTFPPKKVGKIMGIVLAASTLGMTIGTGTTAMLPGIRTAYFVAAVLSLIVIALWWLLIRTPKNEENGQTPAQANIWDSLRIVVKSRAVWVVGLSLFFILGCNVIISSFLPTALAGRGIDAVSAGYYAAAVTIGNLIGCVAAPNVATKVKSTKMLMACLALLAAAGAAFGWQAPNGTMLGICLCVTGIAMGGLMPILMSIPIQLPEIGPTYAGTAGGFTSTLQLLGAVVIPTYVAAPLAGDNLTTLFYTGGICMALVLLLTLVLPGQK